MRYCGKTDPGLRRMEFGKKHMPDDVGRPSGNVYEVVPILQSIAKIKNPGPMWMPQQGPAGAFLACREATLYRVVWGEPGAEYWPVFAGTGPWDMPLSGIKSSPRRSR